MDGVVAVEVRKIDDVELELFGYCYFFDSTMAPLHFSFQLDSEKDEISWRELRVGEKDRNGMKRDRGGSLTYLAFRLGSNYLQAAWAYKVKFGERRPSSK